MGQVTIKTSTVFISKGGKTQVFRSVQEVPAPLRRELERSTNGIQSATILIADRKGRAEILRALKGVPSGLRSTLAAKLEAGHEATHENPKRTAIVSRFFRRNWAEILLPAAVGTIIWLALNYR